ncbi:MAG: glycosyltransferase family 4 protein [Candidatus Accumulibacter sp.]|nr:glycosyltransferase family 4 protein [Accumulibacter sp.]
MRRVVWPLIDVPGGWTGRTNYLRNLAKAIASLPSPRIEILLTGSGRAGTDALDAPLNSFPVLRLPHLRRFSPHWWISKLTARVSSNGGLLASALADHGVSLWAYGPPLGRRSRVPALCWISDFQDIYLPEFFTPEERRAKSANNAHTAATAQAIVLSSADAHADFCRLFPEEAHKARILRFVADIPPESVLPPGDAVLREYDISEPYFHVPNQLWAHKNHRLILDALLRLKKDGLCPLVVSTGLMSDSRDPAFPERLLDAVRAAGFSERFRFLGLVPFAHLAVLMRKSLALINPSRFEGWSTTVEEAKSLGKRILLSSLDVHREQAPPRGLFFDTDDAEGLAERMRAVLGEYDPEIERAATEEACALLPGRLRAYGEAYEELALSVITGSAKS